MVNQLLKLINATGIALLFGCTVAVPEVSSLGSVQFMSSKSPSPFDQDNDNDYISFSGQCVGLVSRFQYRLDSLPWRDISETAPAPGGGETAPASNNYDVDCSNGNFDFYLYMSQINGYTSDHTGNPNYDPARVEIQGLDESGNSVPGTLIYQRPLATGFRLEPSDYTNSAPWWLNVLETDQMIRFHLKLIDSLGNQSRRFSAQSDLDISITTSLVSGVSGSYGEAYTFDGTNCNGTPQSSFTFAAGSGSEMLEICFSAVAVATGATIRLSVAAPGFATQEKQFTILNQHQTYNSLIAGNGYQQRIPHTLIRGASYKFKSDLNPLRTSDGQYVTSFRGSFQVNSQSNFINFTRGSRHFDCGSIGPRTVSIECSNNDTSKVMPFIMNISPNYPSSSLHLTLSSTEQAACSDCLINYEGSPTPISGYQANNLLFNVVSGSTNYSRPRFEYFRRQTPSDCHEINLSLANSDGNTIPANPSINHLTPVFRLETSSPGVSFYQNYNCSSFAQSGPNGNVKKTIPASNGQYFVIGQFTSYNGQIRNGIALINEDGSLDTDYNPMNLAGLIYDLVPLENGRALVAGSFSGGIRLLNENGQEDTSFNFTVNNDVYALAKFVVDANTEHLFIAGSFSEVLSPSSLFRNKLLKIIRTTDVTTGIESFTIAPEMATLSGSFISNILIHGNYLYVTGDFITPIERLARLNRDTFVQDNTWPSTGFGVNGTINALAVNTTDSQLLIGGNFNMALGASRFNFAAISINTGSLINFTTNPSFNAPVYSIKFRANNIYASGQFTSVNGNTDYRRVVKFSLLPGSINLEFDSTWRPTLVGENLVNWLELTTSGIMLIGDFTQVNGQAYSNLSKVSDSNSSDNMDFNKNAQNTISLSFNLFDLTKTIYVRDSSPDQNDIPIQLRDGISTYNFDINTYD